MQLTGAEIVIECLKEQGVDTVFGYPGGAILNVYDALYQHQNEIRHILTSHEQGASHAADGYARATGKVGVCLATSGPGATNLVTGIATAYMDSIPIVAITCNVGVRFLERTASRRSTFPVSRCPLPNIIYRERCGTAGRYDPQGLCHCEERPSGSGADRYSQGCHFQSGGV